MYSSCWEAVRCCRRRRHGVCLCMCVMDGMCLQLGRLSPSRPERRRRRRTRLSWIAWVTVNIHSVRVSPFFTLSSVCVFLQQLHRRMCQIARVRNQKCSVSEAKTSQILTCYTTHDGHRADVCLVNVTLCLLMVCGADSASCCKSR